ncbi:ABC transporter A family member 1-like [Forsythia ovata]|uniref:ABC transporter A family member 1-like n=1 Tax=Forsythia ovata TaxID=205694 RepID=A0ABD1XCQ1_9LAMI
MDQFFECVDELRNSVCFREQWCVELDMFLCSCAITAPNLVSYNALIDAYGSKGFQAEVVELLREMEQNGVQPNVVSISTLLAACGRCCQKVKIDSILKAAKM